jgi:hypothetical protein
MKFLFILSILLCPTRFQQPEITGTWYFDRYGGPHGEISKRAEILEANRLYQGTSFIFTKEGILIRDFPHGRQHNTTSINYRINYPSRLAIIGTDTMRIMLLTPQILELYPNNGKSMAMFLKRKKEGKTAMSAP